MEKMFAVSGKNSLYFLLAENEKDARATIDNDEDIRECSYSLAFTIKYGRQPLYKVVKGVDRRNDLPYSMQVTVDKSEYLTNHPEIYAERKYF